MALRPETQCAKAADALAESMAASPPPAVEKFKREITKSLADETSLNLFGCYNGPDTLVRQALRKARLPDEAITGVVVISLEAGDKIRVFRDGNWTER